MRSLWQLGKTLFLTPVALLLIALSFLMLAIYELSAVIGPELMNLAAKVKDKIEGPDWRYEFGWEDFTRDRED